VIVNGLSWIGFQSYVSFHRGSPSYGLPYSDLVEACAEVADVARAAESRRDPTEGGTPDVPRESVALFVEVPRDRGPLPFQYEYVLHHREGLRVVPARTESEANIVLRVQWSSENGRASFSAWPGPVRDAAGESTTSRASDP
jgi:hypothetical protein